MFLIDRQGIGPVGGERYEGADGLMRVIEQLEAYHCPLHSGSRQYSPHEYETTNLHCWISC